MKEITTQAVKEAMIKGYASEPIYKNKYVGIVCIPFVRSWKDQQITYVITQGVKTDPHRVFLYDHHEYDEPIGTIDLTYMPMQRLGSGEVVNTIVGVINTNRVLKTGTGLSIGGITRPDSAYHINYVTDIVEVSVVDMPHIHGCQIVDTRSFMGFMESLSNSLKQVADSELVHV